MRCFVCIAVVFVNFAIFTVLLLCSFAHGNLHNVIMVISDLILFSPLSRNGLELMIRQYHMGCRRLVPFYLFRKKLILRLPMKASPMAMSKYNLRINVLLQ